MHSALRPQASIIIPTCNHPDTLALAITSVRAKENNYEIIVVSHGEDEAARMQSRQIARDNGCSHLALLERDAAEARFAGFEIARGERIAFLDDDKIWKQRRFRKHWRLRFRAWTTRRKQIREEAHTNCIE
jgi:glycosyltransferase involved in cell wall biosynthesis